MQLDGFRTIYDTEVAYIPAQGVGPVALDTDAMKFFCSVADADQIFSVAVQVVKAAKLVGKTDEFTAQYNSSTHVLTAGADQVYADSAAGGRYMYRTDDGYRPIRIQSPADGLDQFISELVASHDGTKNGLTLISTPQGKKLQWA